MIAFDWSLFLQDPKLNNYVILTHWDVCKAVPCQIMFSPDMFGIWQKSIQGTVNQRYHQNDISSATSNEQERRIIYCLKTLILTAGIYMAFWWAMWLGLCRTRGEPTTRNSAVVYVLLGWYKRRSYYFKICFIWILTDVTCMLKYRTALHWCG